MKLSSIGVCCLIGLCAMNFAIANDLAAEVENTESRVTQKEGAQKQGTQKSVGSSSKSAPPLKPAENINLKDVVDAPLLPESSLPLKDAQPVNAHGKKTAEAASSPNKKTQLPQKNQELIKTATKALSSAESPITDPTKTVTKAQSQNLADDHSPAQNTALTEQNNAPADATPKPGILKKLAQGILGDDGEVGEPLVLLNSEVLPGVSTRLGWSAGASFIGISAPTAVLVLNGVKPGPKLCITAAVHGDELNGIEIVRRLMYNIDPQKLSGSVIGVPIVNLQGFRRGSRYLPDRRDLNRFFPGNPDGSSAARIAYSFFNEVISHCDMLIDLHTGSFRRTNLPQLRADLTNEHVQNLAKKMGAIVVVQSEGAEGCLRRAAVEHGIPAVTLEAGAPHELTLSDIEHGVKSIESAMDGLGMIKRRRFWERAAEPIYYESSWVRATDGGMLFSEIELGADVVAGDLLGIVTDPITNKHSEIRAPYNGQIIGMALNQVMFPGFAAYHIGHKGAVTAEPQLEGGAEPIETQEDSPEVIDRTLDLKLDPTDTAQTTGTATKKDNGVIQATRIKAQIVQPLENQRVGSIATETETMGNSPSGNSLSDSAELTPIEDSE